VLSNVYVALLVFEGLVAGAGVVTVINVTVGAGGCADKFRVRGCEAGFPPDIVHGIVAGRVQ